MENQVTLFKSIPHGDKITFIQLPVSHNGEKPHYTFKSAHWRETILLQLPLHTDEKPRLFIHIYPTRRQNHFHSITSQSQWRGTTLYI